MSDITISQLALLVDIDISCMTGNKTDRTTSEYVSENLAQNNDTSQCGKYVKSIFGDCKDLRDIRNHAQSTRIRLKQISLPYPLGTFRMVPNDKFSEFMQEFDRSSQKMSELVQVFINNYDQNIQRVRDAQNALFNEDDIPTIQEIQQSFNFKVNVQPIPDSNAFDSLLHLGEAVEFLKQQIEIRNNNAVSEARDNLKDRLRVVAHHCCEKLHQYLNIPDSRYYKSWVDNVLDSARLCKSLNVFRDSIIDDVCDIFMQVCVVDHASFRNNPAAISGLCVELSNNIGRL